MTGSASGSVGRKPIQSRLASRPPSAVATSSLSSHFVYPSSCPNRSFTGGTHVPPSSTSPADLTPPAPPGSGGGWALLVLLGVGAAAASALALRAPWTAMGALLARERVVADADDDESAVDVPVARRVHRVR